MPDLIEDLTLLTNVPEKTLKKFIPFINYSIGHQVYETLCCGADVTEIDVGIGTLILKIDADVVKYRFAPSKDLNKTIVETVAKKKSPIVTKIEENLQEKLEKAYKELL